MLIINYLNFRQEYPGGAPDEPDAAHYYDVNGDGQVMPQDALLVINYLNDQQNGGGEGKSAATTNLLPSAPISSANVQSSLAETIALLAQDTAEQTQRRHRAP